MGFVSSGKEFQPLLPSSVSQSSVPSVLTEGDWNMDVLCSYTGSCISLPHGAVDPGSVVPSTKRRCSDFAGCFFSLLLAGGPSCRGSARDPSTFWDGLFLPASWDLHPSDTDIFKWEEVCLLADVKFSHIL